MSPFISSLVLMAVFLFFLAVDSQFYKIKSSKIEQVYFKGGKWRNLQKKHVYSTVILGFFPVLWGVDTNMDWFLFSGKEWKFLIFTPLLFLMAYKGAIKDLPPDEKKKFIISEDSRGSQLLYFVNRSLYLFAYELFFRGWLFWTIYQYAGLVYAIVINIILYVIAHWYSEKKEIIGCVFFGAFTCLATYYTGNIWVAVIFHLIISHTFEGVMMKKFNLQASR